MARNYITLNEAPIFGDFIMRDYENEDTVLFDTRTDGGDVPPLLMLCPVVSITVENGILCVLAMTHWERM